MCSWRCMKKGSSAMSEDRSARGRPQPYFSAEQTALVQWPSALVQPEKQLLCWGREALQFVMTRPLSMGEMYTVDICSCQIFFSLRWFLFCLLEPGALVSSLSKPPVGLKIRYRWFSFFILLQLLLSEIGALYSDLGNFLSIGFASPCKTTTCAFIVK